MSKTIIIRGQAHDLEPVAFVDDRLAIRPHTATEARNLRSDDQEGLTLRAFSGGARTAVYRLPNGDYHFELADGRPHRAFATGPLA